MVNMTYKVGIIGCGQIASLFEEDAWRVHPCTHAGAYTAVAATKIVAAADINHEHLINFSNKWGVDSLYSDYTSMLENECLDIVSVTANTPLHCEMVIKAAQSGVKAIFCEKPIATSLKEADAMIEVCDREGVKLVVNHTRRWDSYYQEAKNLIDNGEIGKVTSITGYFTSGLLIMGTHLFDIFNYLVGDAKWVVGEVEKNRNNTDPSGNAMIGFENGVVGYAIGSSIKEYLIFEIDIQGTKGRINIMNNGKIFKYWTCDETKLHVDYNNYNELKIKNLPQIEQNNVIVTAIEDIIRAIEEDRDGMCSGKDARKALEIALAIHKSALSNAKILLPLEDSSLRVMTR